MAGNENSGRKPLDDPKALKSVRIPRSTLEYIQDIAYQFDTTESALIQTAVESFAQSLKTFIKKT